MNQLASRCLNNSHCASDVPAAHQQQQNQTGYRTRLLLGHFGLGNLQWSWNSDTLPGLRATCFGTYVLSD